jgi:hypothetical protein
MVSQVDWCAQANTQGSEGMFSTPSNLCVRPQVILSHQVTNFAQPAIIHERVIGLNASAKIDTIIKGTVDSASPM